MAANHGLFQDSTVLGVSGTGAPVPDGLVVKLHIEPTCQLGEQLFRVRTKSGISYARNFFVGQFPALEEKEPNTLLEEAQPITPGITIAGVARNEDTDYYKIEAKKGERISVECEAHLQWRWRSEVIR